jgi:hypothetical protein
MGGFGKLPLRWRLALLVSHPNRPGIRRRGRYLGGFWGLRISVAPAQAAGVSTGGLIRIGCPCLRPRRTQSIRFRFAPLRFRLGLALDNSPGLACFPCFPLLQFLPLAGGFLWVGLDSLEVERLTGWSGGIRGESRLAVLGAPEHRFRAAGQWDCGEGGQENECGGFHGFNPPCFQA